MADTIYCPKCGAENPADEERCRSCKAGISGVALVDEREEERMHFQQETFQWRWVLISFLVIAGLHTILVLVVFQMVLIDNVFAQLGVGLIPYLVGGILIGWLSPGKTFLEPLYAAILPAVIFPPLVEWFNVQALRPANFSEALDSVNWPVALAPILVYIMLALFGAWVGEKIQGTV
jgi:hypothetical protein